MMQRSCWRAGPLLLILGVSVAVLGGCQKTTVDVSRGSLDVEGSTATAAPEPSKAEPAAAAVAVPEPATIVVAPASPPAAPAAEPRSAPRAVQASYGRPAPPPVRPTLVTVPARTILIVELDKTLSSHSSQVGESFRGHLTQDVAADGEVVLPRGSVVLGRVSEAKPAKKVGGRARLSLEFHSLELPDGRQIPIEVVFAEAGKSATTRDAAIIGGSTLGGAVLGRAVDKGEGTAIGAIVGGLAGAAVAHETRAKPVVVNSGTQLSLELVRPVTVEVLS